MKPTQHTISLHNPCHEDWEGMSLTDRGRYCAACQKEVIDFTLMTDGQIIDVFKKAKDNPPCGNFFNTQLDRPLIDNRYKPSFAAMVAKRVAASVLLLQSVTTAALAQQVKKHAPTTQHTQKNKQKAKARYIRGSVVDTTHYASLPEIKTVLAGVAIYIKGTDIKTLTDSAGNFTLQVPDTTRYGAIVVSGKQGGYIIDDVSATPIGDGYEAVVMHRQPQQPAIQLADIIARAPGNIYQTRGGGGFTVQRDGGRNPSYLYVIDGVDVRSEAEAQRTIKPQSFWQRITNPFRKKKTTNEAK